MGGIGLVNLDVGGLAKTVTGLLDNLFTSDEERLDAERKITTILQADRLAQVEVNKVEAAHRSVFVAGWRPAIGWSSACGIFYHFVGQPLSQWVIDVFALWQGITEMPILPTLDIGELIPLVLAMLGVAGYRTYEKVKGVSK